MALRELLGATDQGNNGSTGDGSHHQHRGFAGGALLLVPEAMKMENKIRAPRTGRVKSVLVNTGDRVNTGDALVEFEE